MHLQTWVRQQIRGRVYGILRSSDYFDAEMFRTWAAVSAQAGFSIWDLVLELAGDQGIERFLKQVIGKLNYEQRLAGNAECFGRSRRSA